MITGSALSELVVVGAQIGDIGEASSDHLAIGPLQHTPGGEIDNAP